MAQKSSIKASSENVLLEWSAKAESACEKQSIVLYNNTSVKVKQFTKRDKGGSIHP